MQSIRSLKYSALPLRSRPISSTPLQYHFRCSSLRNCHMLRPGLGLPLSSDTFAACQARGCTHRGARGRRLFGPAIARQLAGLARAVFFENRERGIDVVATVRDDVAVNQAVDAVTQRPARVGDELALD